ncbi:MAG: methylated-DNA--[protein]-cysteine S-methyltransferase [Acidimicrobiales bacterium]
MTVTTARTSRNRTARSIDVTLTTTIDSPIGPLTLTSVEGDLTGLQMANAAHPPKGTEMWVPDRAAFKEVVGQLEAYFAGELRDFEVPLRAEGTEFQRRVWDGLRQIPFGETWSYGRLAEHVGNVQACRAVGLANGRNPIAVIVPCHRVIGANGTLTGYGGGLDRKAWLLDHERRVRGGTA